MKFLKSIIQIMLQKLDIVLVRENILGAQNQKKQFFGNCSLSVCVRQNERMENCGNFKVEISFSERPFLSFEILDLMIFLLNLKYKFHKNTNLRTTMVTFRK